MNALQKFFSFFRSETRQKRERLSAAVKIINGFTRKYEAASVGRRTSGWKATGSSANAELEVSLPTLRNRSRQLVRDNAHASKGMQVITSNVIGWGIVTKVKVSAAQNNSSGKNKQVELQTKQLSNLWKSWAESTAVDYDGRCNFYGLQRLIMRGIAESGEMLIRRRRTGRTFITGADGFETEIPPFQLQVLEGDYLDTNNFFSKADNGNTIVMGIEFDRNGKRVAYHIYEEHPGNAFAFDSLKSKFKTIRVPAEDMLHVYRLDRAGQIRGAPWLSPVMLRLKDFDEYEDAQLIRQKIAACFSVFIKDVDGLDTDADPEEDIGQQVEPGRIEYLPPGKDISFGVPPGVEGFKDYSGVTLHEIAAGLGITYESMTGDYSQVNFSSARMGALEMNKSIDEWRDDIIVTQFLNPIFQWWKDAAILIGQKVDRAWPQHTAPRREMIDPAKETAALKDRVRSGFITLSDAIIEQGYDPETHFEQIKKDNDLLDKLGLVLDTDPRKDPKKMVQGQPSKTKPDTEDEDEDE